MAAAEPLPTILTRDSSTKSSVTCRNQHGVQLFTRCDRKQAMKEAGDLYLDILSDYFYQDLAHAGNDAEPAIIHAYIETIHEHYHPGQEDKYSKCTDDYLEAEAEEVDSTDDVFGDVDSIGDVFDIDEPISGKPFVELDLPSSQSSQTYMPSSQAPPPDDARRLRRSWFEFAVV
ncbi:hypothetical protein V1520DRAFT_379007 [Lipomyces starkeyi]